MNLLKRSSPPPQGAQPSMYGGRLTPSPHYTAASTPGSPLTTRAPSSSLLLQMGGENSAFKALVPGSAIFGAADDIRRLHEYETDSDEEINVNDESDVEMDAKGGKSGASTPVEVVDPPVKEAGACQPLQLTMHDRD